MEVVSETLKRVGAKIEDGFEGVEKWQIVAGTAVTTILALTLADLVSRWRDIAVDMRQRVFEMVRMIPAVRRYITSQLNESRKEIEKGMFDDASEGLTNKPLNELPDEGWSKEVVLATASSMLGPSKFDWKDGKISGGTFSGGDDKFTDLLEKVYGLTAFSNPLHVDIFPGVRKMEAEVVRLTVSLFHGTDEQCGCMTSGGSESILMACKAMRDWGRHEKGIRHPELVMSYTTHAGFDKAASLLGIKVRKVAVDPKTYMVDLRAMRRAINKNTVLLVASAPQFPHGIIDDVEGVGELGLRYGIPVHVDCCMGGFLLPFMERAGYPIPPFDFRVPGVTSISADTHKYGKAPKGSSVVMYRSVEYRHYQYFITPDWPGGIYATATVPGSRPGGLVSVCWAALMAHGVTGYTEVTRRIISTARRLKALLLEIPEIKLFGDPLTSIVAFGSDKINILMVGDLLTKKGWHPNFIQYPPGLHVCLTDLQATDDFAERFVKDVKEAIVELGKNPGDVVGVGKVYGTAAGIPDKSLVGEAAKVFLTCYYQTEPVAENRAM